MGRRRLVLVGVVLAGVALLVSNRLAGGDDPAGEPGAAERTVPAWEGAPGARPETAAVPGTPAAAGPPETVGPTPATPPEDDGVVGEESLDPAAAAAVRQAAERFAARWASPDPGWHEELAALATPSLGEALSGADPPRPPPEITGSARILFDAPQWARVGVPTTTGTIVLDLVADGGGWLVAAIDWRPE